MKSLNFLLVALVLSLTVAAFAGEKSESIQVLAEATEVVAWKFHTNGTIYATPRIHNGIIYIGSHDKTFYAVNAETGAEVWHYETANQIYTTAAIYENIVCFASGNLFIALDLSGNFLWQYTMYEGNVVNQNDAWDYFQSSPQLVDSIAYVGTEQGLVYGFNVNTGAVVFQCQTAGKSSIETTPFIQDNRIFFGDWDGVLYVFDINTGNMLWQYDTRSDKTYSWVNAIQTDPLIVNGNVYFAGRSCFLYSLNAETGAKNWMFHDPGDMWLLGGPTICDNLLYMGSSNQHFLQAFDINTGVKQWTSNVDYRIFGHALIDGENLFVGTGNETGEPLGSVFAIDRVTGAIINKFTAGGQVHSSVQILNGLLYFGCADGFLYALNKENMLNQPISETMIKDNSKIDLGKIPQGTEPIDTYFYIYNQGDGADSVTLSLSGAATLRNVTTIEPMQFHLAPGDSQKISINIAPAALTVKKYSLSVIINSANNLIQNKFNRSLALEIVRSTGITDNNQKSAADFLLAQNYPNPFNPETTISFTLPKPAGISLVVMDILGQQIKTLATGNYAAGEYSLQWDGRNEQRNNVASGFYFYRLQINDPQQLQVITRKMLLMR
ncbi:MAG TPA: PQQ-binding-like beta-propeller repeat protein [bacterium]|nr:PQQ-binding-like beta-propeller repeat protein [bacterium]HPN46031.1 PQQ-binding-like beta-propeller repeat protein [bacterium]